MSRKSATGIRVSGDCSAVIGENVVVTNSNTASIAPELVRGSLNFVNITIADGFKIETDSEQVDYTNGYSPASAYKNGTYWKTNAEIFCSLHHFVAGRRSIQ